MQDNNNEHFTDDKDYIAPGCMSPHDDYDLVGNQPEVIVDDNFDQRSNAAIPKYQIAKE